MMSSVTVPRTTHTVTLLDAIRAEVIGTCAEMGLKSSTSAAFLEGIIVESLTHRLDEWHARGIYPESARVEIVLNVCRSSLRAVTAAASTIARVGEREVLDIDVVSSLGILACRIFPLCSPVTAELTSALRGQDLRRTHNEQQ